MRITLASLLTVILTLQTFGEAPADSVKVFFRIGYSQFDPRLDNNRAAMDRFIEEVSKAHEANEIDSIVVRAYASPDGAYDANVRLAQRRCSNITELIAQRADIPSDIIRSYPEGVAWDELRRIIAEDPQVPSREKILYILDNVPVWTYNSAGKIVDGRKKRLMDLDRGDTYRWLYANIFPQLRNAVAIALFTTRKEVNVSVIEPEPECGTDMVETVEIVDLPDQYQVHDSTAVSDKEVKSEVPGPGLPVTGMTPTAYQSKPFYIAVKTNMLYDAALVPNLGAEFYLGKNLSLYGEWMYAWWDNDHRHRYWRVYGGDLGLRWWFGRKAHAKPLTGHHLGLYGGILTFDFEAGDTGYMGGQPGGTLWDRWLVNAGVEYGYSLPVASRLNIDFSVGFGYLGGNYIKYYPFDNDYYHDKEYRMRFFGPTKAEISLVWRIGRGNSNGRKGGGR